MPRETQKRSVREEVPLNAQRPVQLQAARRFFSSQGSDRATREARALANAFDAGTNLFLSELERRNKLGVERAVTSRGAGEDRDAEDKNAGFNRAWDQLDAEADLNSAKSELPVILEEANAEDLTERQVQALITDYMKASFEGIEAQSAYGEIMAPGLLQLEQNLLTVHRDQQLERTQVEYRSKIMSNLTARFESSVTDENELGTFDYEYLATQTNIFFDGKSKKIAYWETVYDFAIRRGRPDLITGVPERFPNGDFTGINDPKQADEHRAAINSATVVAANMAKARQEAQEDLFDDMRFDAMYSIYEARRDGQDVTPLLRELKRIPGTEFSDITAAKNFGDTQLEEGDSRSADLTFTSPLWKQIHEGSAGIDAIFFARRQGFLGIGPQADKMMDDMMSTARSVRQNRERFGSQQAVLWRQAVNKQYNANKGGLLTAINPVMERINLDANAFYEVLLINGTPPIDAFHKTADRFDPLVALLPDIEEAEIIGRRSQTDFTATAVVTSELMKRVATGEVPFSAAFSGVNPSIISDRVVEDWADGKLSDKEAETLILLSQ